MPTQLFHCAACGAPLLPRGSATVMHCPYCQAAVIVPAELRQASRAEVWHTLVFDSFAANENNWLVGSRPSEYFAVLNQTLAEGRYRWVAQASRAYSITTAWLMGYSVADFHLAVNCKHLQGSRAGSGWGLVFRIQDNQNFYWFRLTDQQRFAFAVSSAGQWQNLVEWTHTDAIKPQGVNQVEVLAIGSHFTFLINGRVVSEVDDAQFAQGLTGFAIEAYHLGEETTFDFLDFLLRAP